MRGCSGGRVNGVGGSKGRKRGCIVRSRDDVVAEAGCRRKERESAGARTRGGR